MSIVFLVRGHHLLLDSTLRESMLSPQILTLGCLQSIQSISFWGNLKKMNLYSCKYGL